MPATRVFDHFHILLRKPSRFLERFPVLCFPAWRDYLPIIGIYYYIYSKWENKSSAASPADCSQIPLGI